MHILRAKPEDAETLTRLALEAKRHWRYPEEWMARWREVLTVRPEQIESEEYYYASDAGHIIGFYGLHHERDMLRLEHLWVSAKAMARGTGRALFIHAANRTRALGFNAMHIESDPNAAGFYERMGARRVGVNVTEWDGQRRELPLMVYDVRVSA